MKFIATKDCFGFRDGFWNKGAVVETQQGEKDPPPPFEPVEAKAEKPGKGSNAKSDKSNAKE